MMVGDSTRRAFFSFSVVMERFLGGVVLVAFAIGGVFFFFFFSFFLSSIFFLLYPSVLFSFSEKCRKRKG